MADTICWFPVASVVCVRPDHHHGSALADAIARSDAALADRLLDALMDIEGIVRDTSYRVPGDPESPSKEQRILDRICAALGPHLTEQSDDRGGPDGEA